MSSLPLTYASNITRSSYSRDRRQASQQQTLIFSAAAVIGIFLLLQATFWSWHLALSVFITVLASLSGGLLTTLLAGGEVTLGSLFGFLIILGLSIRLNTVLIKHLQNLEHKEGLEFGPDLVVRGAVDRMKPVLITVLGLWIAFLPILFSGSIPGLEILHPMVIVSIGGLVTMAFFSLLVVPALYMRFGMHSEIESAEAIDSQPVPTT